MPTALTTALRCSTSTGLAIGLMMISCGCSSLGLSLFPTGHFLTKQADEVLAQSPRGADIARELSMDVEPVHYLQPGDTLLIEPIELDSEVRIPADQKVLADGSVDLGKYGRVVVAGLTIEGAESLIESTIVHSGEKATAVNVRMLDPIHRYYVLGEVNSPGSYPLEGHESVLDGILAAGGLTSAASPCKILLARPTDPDSCRVTLPVCYREITQLGDTSTNYQLKPGDRIFVATRSCYEDMMFWRANETCDRCCKCQSACMDPRMIPDVNPMGRVIPTASPQPGPASLGAESGMTPIKPESITPMDPSPIKADPAAVPLRLPAAEAAEPAAADAIVPSADGELDFDNSQPIGRFAPMWVTPSNP
ncbi:polysaccharide biosynthesis/export family protein [Rubripirellula lacrimiformis]|nr:SLBB domain-containing protein [Rubripirellula lacrimiformis]